MIACIGRREFITLLGGVAVGWPVAARAQQGERVRRIGVLMARAASDPEGQKHAAAFQRGLEELGWSSPRNVEIEFRWPAGDGARALAQTKRRRWWALGRRRKRSPSCSSPLPIRWHKALFLA
jgi:hypothetical protein